MKKNFSTALLAILAIAASVSCQKTSMDYSLIHAIRAYTFTASYPQVQSTKLSINETTGKTAWEAGDKICVHDAAKANFVITLTAGDIDANGVATFTIPAEAGLTGDTFYASYPGEVLPSSWSSAYDYCYFTNSNQPLAIAKTSSTELAFNLQNAVGIITFAVTGDFDSYTFEGNAQEAIGYDGICVRAKYIGKLYNPGGSGDRCGAAIKRLSGTLSDGKAMICIPTGETSISLSDGFTIKLYKGENCVKVASTHTALTLGRSALLPLGNITSALKDYVAPSATPDIAIFDKETATDLSAKECANCYIIGTAGNYIFKAVKGNDATAALEGAQNAEIIWETYGNSTDVVKNSVVANVACVDGVMYVQMPSTFHTGNALIAAKNAEGKILWSWHIWATDKTIAGDKYGDTAENAKEIMNYNLGAIGEVGTVESFGLQYQWGRKDPFVGAGAIDGSSSAKICGTAMTIDSTRMSDASAVMNPTRLYVIPKNIPQGDTEDSVKDWLTPSDGNRWNAESSKTINDPCPAGWKVPVDGDDNRLFGNLTASNVVADKSNGTFTFFTDYTFPYAHYISYSSGKVSSSESYIHTAKGSGPLSYGMRVVKGTYQQIRKASPGAIRCVKEAEDN